MRSVRYSFILAAVTIVIAASNLFAQAPKRLVLWEEFTQWNCPPCGQTNPVLEPLLNSYAGNVMHIWFHGNFPDANDDPMYLWDVNDHQARYNYYGVNSEPQARVDGVAISPSGGYAGDPQNFQYDAQYLNNEMNSASTLALSVSQTTDGSGTTHVTVTANSSVAVSGNYFLRVAVVKAAVDTPDAGSPYRNPEVNFPNVVEKMLPNASGTAFSVAKNTPTTFTFTYNQQEIMGTGNTSPAFVVAWVQNDGDAVNHAILNAASSLTSYSTAYAQSKVGSMGSTTTFADTITNTHSVPMTVQPSLTSNLLNNWGITVNGNTTLDTTTVTLAPGQSTTYTISVQMTGSTGIGTNVFGVNETWSGSGVDTSVNLTFNYFSATNDFKTLVVDGTDGSTQRASIYTQTLGQTSTPYGELPEVYSVNFLQQDPSINTVIYLAGDGGISDANYAAMSNILSAGGRVLIAGDVIYSFAQGDGSAQSFFANMLHTSYVRETGTINGYVGVKNDSISNNFVSRVAAVGANTEYYFPDAIQPMDNSAKPIVYYTKSDGVTSDDTVGGVRVQSGNYKAVYLAFGLEALANTTEQSYLMSQIMKWFNSATAVWEDPTPTTTPALINNYPNPFSDATTIQFDLPKSEEVTVNIYDMKGSLVGTAVNGMMQAGANTVNFDGSNLPAGVYEYRLTAPSGVMRGLMTLVKQ